MEDLIKRSNVIKALYKYDFVSKDVIEREIKAIPSADRPSGEWVDDGLDGIGAMGVEYRWQKCSQCGFRISKSPSAYYPNFCEVCGAKMKGADDEA